MQMIIKKRKRKKKTDNISTDKKISDKSDKPEENKKEEENKNNKIDVMDFKNLMAYLESKFKEKAEIKTDILEIKNKIMELIEKYNEMGKELEILTKELNTTMKINNKNNISTYDNNKNKDNNNINNENNPKAKIVFIIIAVIGLTIFVLYLYKNGYFKKKVINEDVNYLDINSVNGVKNENEMSLMNSKIEI